MTDKEIEALKLRSEVARNLENIVPTEFLWKEILGLPAKVVKDFKDKLYADLNDLSDFEVDDDDECDHDNEFNLTDNDDE